MKKQRIRIIAAVLLIACLAGTLPVSAAADRKVHISSPEDWARFAELCSTDSASTGMSAELTEDISLEGMQNIAVPIFCGSFQGNGHTVSGIQIDAQTDVTGLFRIVSENAGIENLNVSAKICGGEEINTIGILSGENRGNIKDCRVSGSISGKREIGGLAGKNSGIIEDCVSEAAIEGTYRVGGIAGTNDGTLKNCVNFGEINLEANESATNVGGIAGVNENLILSCSNDGNLGYLHTGYNVGGIAGISRGFISGCVNAGDISGRRDVGGIVGQMEPSFRLEYGQNAMELLGSSTEGFTASLGDAGNALESAIKGGAVGFRGVLDRLTAFSQDLSEDISGLFAGMNWQNEAKGELEAIRLELENIRNNLPINAEAKNLIDQIKNLMSQFDKEDPSAWLDQVEELSELISELAGKLIGFSGVHDSLGKLTDLLNSLAGTVMGGVQSFGEQSTGVLQNASSELSSLSEEISSILSQTGSEVNNVRTEAEEAAAALSDLQSSIERVLEGKTNNIEDISEQVNSQDKGMVVSCENRGDFSADYNVGGIVGNLSKELTVDQEADTRPSVNDLLNTDTTLFIRATVYDCSNIGNASSRYDHAGGIMGFGNCGAIVRCRNSGNVDAGKSHAGGIAGCFRGTIADCASLGSLSGTSYVGGIAGEADRIDQCTALPVMNSEGAFFGGIAGNMDEGEGNLFAGDVSGGNNGVSYTGMAEKTDWKSLMAAPRIPPEFKKLTICFEVEGEPLSCTSVSYGKAAPEAPSVESRDGKFWCWDSFCTEGVFCNQIVDGHWQNFITTLASDEEVPLFLVEGRFDDRASLLAEQGEKEGEYYLQVKDSDLEILTVRFLTEPEGNLSVNGKKLSYTRDGKYIVFQIQNGSTFEFQSISGKEGSLLWLYCVLAAVGAGLIVLMVCLIVRHHRHKNPKKDKKSDQKADGKAAKK